MEPWVIVAALLALVAIGVLVLVQRRNSARRAPSEPALPESAFRPAEGRQVAEPEQRHVLSRDALVSPDRTLDLRKWDNSPDPDQAEPVEELTDADVEPDSFVIDRDFLAKRKPDQPTPG